MKREHAIKRAAVVIFGILMLFLLPGCGKSGDADVDSAMTFFDQRKFAEAVPLLEAALDKRLTLYKKSEVLTTIGNCHNELENFELALEFHNKAIKEDPNYHEAYVNRGIVYRLLGEFDKAEESYMRALALNPDYAELHASLGALAIYQGDPDKAVMHLEKAVKLDDSLPVSHSNLAYAYATVGRFAEADAELQKAIERGYHQPELIQARIDELKAEAEAGKGQ